MSNKKTSKTKTGNQKQIFKKPSWKSGDVFTITGNQLQELTNLAGAFRPIVEMADMIIQTGELAGTISTEYVYQDGAKASEKDPRVAQMREQHEAELSSMRKQIEDYKAKVAEIQKAAADAGAKTKEEVVDQEQTKASS